MNIENRILDLTVAGTDRAVSEAQRPVSTGAASFGDELGKAVRTLDKLQTDADVQVDQVSAGGGNLHEMAISLEKADIAMRLATKVRNKIVDAYHEIVKMGV